MKTSRTEYALRNFASNTMSTAVNALLSFISRTVFVYILGETYLGVSGLFTNILGVLSLAELGVASAVSFSLYKPLAESDSKKVGAIINFYRNIYRVVALVVTFIGLAVIPFLNIIVKEANGIANLRLIYLLYLFNTVTSYLISYKATILTADQKDYFVVTINTIIKAIIMVIQIALLIHFRDFVIYLVAEIVIQFIGKIYINKFVDKQYPYLRANKEKLSEDERKIIFRKIRALAVHKFGDVSINQTDNIITSAFISVTTVGLVSNFVMIINVVNAFVRSFFNSATAGFGNLIATETAETSYRISKAYDYLGFLFYGWSAVVLYFCLIPFVTIWMGESRLVDAITVALLCINYYFTGARTPLANVKIAAGIFEQDQWVPFVQAVTNIGVSIICAKYWGLKGVYIGTLVSSMWPNIVRPIIIFKYVFQRSSADYFKRYFSRIVFLFLIACSIGMILKLFWSTNAFFNLLLSMLTSSVICGVALLWISKDKEEAAYLFSIVKKVLGKFL